MITPDTEEQTPSENETLEGFYQWAKKIGHWRISEAVERYRRLNDE